MMRLLPKSLFGRMVLTLLGGFIIAHTLSIALSLHERRGFISHNMLDETAHRIADTVNLLDSFDAQERKKFLRLLGTRHMKLSLDTPPFADSPIKSQHIDFIHKFQTILRGYLGEKRSIKIAEVQQHDLPSAMQVQLTDGTWVTFSHERPPEFRLPYGLLLNLLILLLTVITFLFFAVRWMTKPLLVLANAAEELGNNMHRPPLAETGPTEVKRAAHAFNRMQSQLINYVQGRTRILAAMSHDLKTPITRLRLRTELLKDPELKIKFDKDLKEMEAMVTATLDYMRGIDTREPAQPVDIMALLESIQADAEEMGQEVNIEGACNAPYKGEPQALKRGITNLIDNAIKYGQCAHVSVQDSAKELRIIIRDNGPGIPEDKLEQVQEPFYRLEASRNRDTGGTGLGLTIARSIAEAHGGKLSLRNGSNGGLEVALLLPR